MILDTVDEKKKGVHTRYLILLIIFIVTAVNYADRATLSIAGTEVAKEVQLSAVSMGYIFSAFGWAYLLMQIPGGWLLDALAMLPVAVPGIVVAFGYLGMAVEFSWAKEFFNPMENPV